MTKVIFAGSDEWGGCGNAHPDVAEGPDGEKKPAATSAAQGIQEGVESHGPRCLEQPFSDLCGEQPE